MALYKARDYNNGSHAQQAREISSSPILGGRKSAQAILSPFGQMRPREVNNGRARGIHGRNRGEWLTEERFMHRGRGLMPILW